jgi:hypothetical protein
VEQTRVLEQLQRLIDEGARVVATRRPLMPNEFGAESVQTPLFQQWGTSVVTLFTAAFPADHHYVGDAKRLLGDAWNADDADKLLAVVKAAHHAVANEIVQVTTTDGVQDPFEALDRIMDGFHAVTKQLRDRRRDQGTGKPKQPRPTLNVADEYDVQDLLHALLRLFFEDIRREEWTPSLAGAAKRIDLVLWQERIAIETKMTRASLDQTTLVEELIIDIRHYKEHPRCKTLVCFVYDPLEIIANPAAVESDLAEHTDGLDVRVAVRHR